ncbi:hypothetical protein NTGM5_180075 [Candidatus Nitrotoga sp. M5]|nr:hypothetical protein NTGM5_180075 [Candidatus Nitrotoga sp. M5]
MVEIIEPHGSKVFDEIAAASFAGRTTQGVGAGLVQGYANPEDGALRR